MLGFWKAARMPACYMSWRPRPTTDMRSEHDSAASADEPRQWMPFPYTRLPHEPAEETTGARVPGLAAHRSKGGQPLRRIRWHNSSLAAGWHPGRMLPPPRARRPAACLVLAHSPGHARAHRPCQLEPDGNPTETRQQGGHARAPAPTPDPMPPRDYLASRTEYGVDTLPDGACVARARAHTRTRTRTRTRTHTTSPSSGSRTRPRPGNGPWPLAKVLIWL